MTGAFRKLDISDDDRGRDDGAVSVVIHRRRPGRDDPAEQRKPRRRFSYFPAELPSRRWLTQAAAMK